MRIRVAGLRGNSTLQRVNGLSRQAAFQTGQPEVVQDGCIPGCESRRLPQWRHRIGRPAGTQQLRRHCQERRGLRGSGLAWRWHGIFCWQGRAIAAAQRGRGCRGYV